MDFFFSYTLKNIIHIGNGDAAHQAAYGSDDPDQELTNASNRTLAKLWQEQRRWLQHHNEYRSSNDDITFPLKAIIGQSEISPLTKRCVSSSDHLLQIKKISWSRVMPRVLII